MLFRFCLYGFLKNQQYYEPFLILAFREKGLSFFLIGILIGFREICINIMEIPTGAIADLYGRRRSMIFSFAGYILSFLIFALSSTFVLLLAAMLLFAVGEAFRTGTHKAMIFDWLASQGKAKEKTKNYGYTLTWSKRGSSLSVLIAAAIVILSRNYSMIFWYSIVPYVIGIINFLGYPAFLDGEVKSRVSLKDVYEHLAQALSSCLKRRPLRRLLVESMTHEGVFSTSKGYLQPVLKQAALALPFLVMWEESRRAAVLVGIVYFFLHMLSSWGSQLSHRFSSLMGSEGRAARTIWTLELCLYLTLIVSLATSTTSVSIVMFVLMAVLQDMWKPIYLSRIDSVSDARMGATVLSVDSQAKSMLAFFLAPALGFAVDRLGFWPVGAVGAAGAGIVLLWVLSKEHGAADTAAPQA